MHPGPLGHGRQVSIHNGARCMHTVDEGELEGELEGEHHPVHLPVGGVTLQSLGKGDRSLS